MASVLSKFDLHISFWEQNAQFKTVEPFKGLYKKDRSRGKVDSSNIMWGVAMLIEIDDNRLAMYPEHERREIIATDFFGKEKYNWEKIDTIVDAYKKLVLTPKKRALLIQREKTDERNKFLSSVKYSMENAKELDTLLSNTPKFLDILKKLEDSVRLENLGGGNKKGGREESLSEKGII